MATLQQLLAPQVILDAVTSRIKQPGDALQRFFGMGLEGGPAIVDDPKVMRYAAYDIFDSIQDVANFRAPGTAPGTIARNPVGQVPVTLPRIHIKMPLLYEELGNLRPLGQTSGNIDAGGKNYITRQETTLKMYFQNAREFMVAGMLNGGFSFNYSGDDWTPVLGTGGSIAVDFQIPAANKSQLNMLGAGNIITIPWSNTASATIFEDVLAINAAYWQLHGYPLSHIWINSLMWGYVTANTGIKARSGTANVVFESYDRAPNFDDKMKARDEFKAVLKCLPFITWHIYDGGAKLNGTFTKWFGDTKAVFLPEPSPDVFQMLVGGEYVVEQDTMPAAVKRGLNFWPRYVAEPSRIEIVGLDQCVPIIRVPKAISVATVVGF